MNAPKKRLGEILIERKLITASQLELALKKQKESGLPLGEVIIRLKYVAENIMLEALSKELNVDFLNISENDYQIVDKSLTRVLPLEVCQRLHVVPLFQLIDDDFRELTLAMGDPLADAGIKEVEALTKCKVTPLLTTYADIEGAIQRLYDIKIEITGRKVSEASGDIVSLVNRILMDAVGFGASDIHIEAHEKAVHVRMRIDGILQLTHTLPIANLMPIVSRIKIMASEQNSLMKIEERRLPQDGALSRVIGGHAVDFRVSTLPTIYGEKVVMRLFDKDRSSHIGRISDLKMSPRMETEFRRCVRQPTGIVIITGPTGSGKTTTLHAVVNETNDVGINIVTVEDPVEYHAKDYVNQSSLRTEVGYSYARALRAIMRQDPDVILIGEVRDLETASIAVQAALTGHKVYTTLHTEDAATAIVRMVDIGIEQFLVSTTLVSAINQRLLRKVCTNCMEDYVPAMAELLDVGIDKEVAQEILDTHESHNLIRGRGCPACRQTGYRGRQSVFEIVSVNPEVRNLIQQKANADVITRALREKERINMIFEEGVRMVLTGVTTVGELQRLPRGDYDLKSIAEIAKDAELPEG